MLRTRTLLTVVALAAVSIAVPAMAGPLDLQQVPASAKWVVHADLETFLASKVGGVLLQEFQKQEIQAGLAVIKNMTGINPLKDIASMTVYGNAFTETAGVILIRGKFDKEKLTTILKTNSTFKETKHGERTVYQWTDNPDSEKPGPDRFGCFAHDDMAVLAGSMDMLKGALDVLDKKADSMAKEGASKLVVPTPKGAFVVGAVSELPDVAKGKPESAFFNMLNAGSFEFGEAGDKVYVRLSLTTKTDRVAADLAKMGEGVLGFLDIVQQVEVDGKPAFQPAEMATIAKDLSISVKDKTVTAKLETSADNVISLVKWAASQQKKAGKSTTKEAGAKAEFKVEVKTEAVKSEK